MLHQRPTPVRKPVTTEKPAPIRKPATIRVTSAQWRGEESVTEGVRVSAARTSLFVPHYRLREVADQLHDAADHFEDRGF